MLVPQSSTAGSFLSMIPKTAFLSFYLLTRLLSGHNTKTLFPDQLLSVQERTSHPRPHAPKTGDSQLSSTNRMSCAWELIPRAARLPRYNSWGFPGSGFRITYIQHHKRWERYFSMLVVYQTNFDCSQQCLRSGEIASIQLWQDVYLGKCFAILWQCTLLYWTSQVKFELDRNT